MGAKRRAPAEVGRPAPRVRWFGTVSVLGLGVALAFGCGGDAPPAAAPDTARSELQPPACGVDEVRELFDTVVDAIGDPDQYVVWHIPIISGRKL